jgi:hypothetical protein
MVIFELETRIKLNEEQPETAENVLRVLNMGAYGNARHHFPNQEAAAATISDWTHRAAIPQTGAPPAETFFVTTTYPILLAVVFFWKYGALPGLTGAGSSNH